MEKATQNIVVGTDSYAYRHRTGDECTVNNTGISHSDSAWFWTLTEIQAKKDNKEEIVQLLMPKFVSHLIEATLQKAPDTFRQRNKVTRFS